LSEHPVGPGPWPADRALDTQVREQRPELARLRRVRDRIDREYAQPLDVEELARGAHMSAGHLSREFRLAYGESPYGYLMTRTWSVCRPAPTGATRRARRWGCRRAWRNR